MAKRLTEMETYFHMAVCETCPWQGPRRAHSQRGYRQALTDGGGHRAENPDHRTQVEQRRETVPLRTRLAAS